MRGRRQQFPFQLLSIFMQYKYLKTLKKGTWIFELILRVPVSDGKKDGVGRTDNSS